MIAENVSVKYRQALNENRIVYEKFAVFFDFSRRNKEKGAGAVSQRTRRTSDTMQVECALLQNGSIAVRDVNQSGRMW